MSGLLLLLGGFLYLSTMQITLALTRLSRLLSFIVTTGDDILCLEVDDSAMLTWYVDAAFTVHADMRSYAGSVFTLGKGSIISRSSTQKRNAHNSTKSEMNGVDDKISKIMWTKKFVDHQGWTIKCDVIMKDNTSTIKLLNNGKESSGKEQDILMCDCFM